MPIYKGTQRITSVAQGTQTINNVYNGTVPVFSSVQYPYRVNIVGDGIVNSYDSSGIRQPIFDFPSAYFQINNTSNTGATWYGIALSDIVFNLMGNSVTNVEPEDGYTCYISKTAWYDFISLMIGYNVIDTDFSVFTIASPFYAIDATEWDQSTFMPKDSSATRTWIFTSSGNNFNMAYRYLTSQEITALRNIILGGATINYITLTLMGLSVEGIGWETAGLIASQSITFNTQYASMNFEWLMNNNQKVTSTTLQSNINNFNFSIRSMAWGCYEDIARLGWNVSVRSDTKLLEMTSYTAPQYNIPGTLAMTLVEPFSGE